MLIEGKFHQADGAMNETRPFSKFSRLSHKPQPATGDISRRDLHRLTDCGKLAHGIGSYIYSDAVLA